MNNTNSKLLSLLLLAIMLILTSSLSIRSPEIQPPEHDETPEESFVRSDVNKDKKLNFEEFLRTDSLYEQLKNEEFSRLDKNQDGIVTEDEYNQHYKQEKEESDKLKGEYFGQIYEKFDENFDKKLNQSELEKVLAKRFLLKPKNNFTEIFKQFDTNNDGGLDLNEYINFDENMSFEKFTPIDEPQNNPILAFKTEKLPLIKEKNLSGKF